MAGEWESSTLGRLADERALVVQTGPFGSQLHAHEYVSAGVPVVATEAIGRRRLITDAMPQIAEATAHRLARHRLKAGDIVFARRGAQATGLSAIVEPQHEGFICGTGALRLRVLAPERLSPIFLSFVLADESARQWLRSHAVGAVMPNLNEEVIRGLPIMLPPMPEQRAIACILASLDDKIELNRRRSRTLEAMARAIFQSWFVDFDPVRAKAAGQAPPGLKPELAALFPDRLEDSPLGPIPAGWRVGPMRELCSRIENGGTPKRQIDDYWSPAEVPWLTSGEVRQQFVLQTENFISRSGLENSSAKMWPPFTTVVALYGATAGFATLLASEMCANQACCGLVSKPDASCFIHQIMSSSLLLLQQQARGSAQQNLSQSIVADLRFTLPSNAVLQGFEKIMRPIYDRSIASIAESRILAALRDALLPKLISGTLRVPDAERIVGRCT